MPETITFGEAKTSRLLEIASACPDTDQFRSLLNDGTRELMRRGHWFATVRKMRGCVYNSCITWPRQVGTVLALNTCAQHVPVFNNWAAFSPMDGSDYECAMLCRSQSMLINDGETPVFNQIECAEGMYIRAYISQPSDVGRSITIYGVDSNGQTVRSERDDGTFQDGVVLTLASPYVSTQKQFRRVTRVLKDPTDGPVRLYQYDSTNNVLKDMAYYEAGETSPSYRHTVLNASRYRMFGGGAAAACACSGGLRQISALIKLQFIPVRYDDDAIQIENIDALKLAMQAIKLGEGYSLAQREAAMMLAVRELNLELADRFPLDQIPTNVNPFGTALPRRAGIGRVI